MSDPITAPIAVEPVVGRTALEAFIRVPWYIYRADPAPDPAWVPPLLAERRQALSPGQPFFEHAEWQGWIARRGGRPVGRISAQVDQLFLSNQHPSTGFFGLIESRDESDVFTALFAAAESWLRDRGMSRVLGPFNLGINQEMGLLVDGFATPPYVMMGHARPYYAAAIERLGYRPVKDALAYEVDRERFGLTEWMRILLQRQAPNVSVRPFQRRNRDAELETMRDIFNDAWSRNWGFVPFTATEFTAVGSELLMLLPDEFIQLAEVDGQPAAFIAMLPNVNEAIADLDGRLLPFGWARLAWRLKVRFPRTGRVALMGVRRRWQHTRLGPALAFLLIQALERPGRSRGLQRVELSWILEDNEVMRAIAERIGGQVSKRYRIYGKDLK